MRRWLGGSRYPPGWNHGPKFQGSRALSQEADAVNSREAAESSESSESRSFGLQEKRLYNLLLYGRYPIPTTWANRLQGSTEELEWSPAIGAF